MGYRSYYSISFTFKNSLESVFLSDGLQIDVFDSEKEDKDKSEKKILDAIDVAVNESNMYAEDLEIDIDGKYISMNAGECGDMDNEIMAFAEKYVASDISYSRTGSEDGDVESYVMVRTPEGKLEKTKEWINEEGIEVGSLSHLLMKLGNLDKIDKPDRVVLELMLGKYNITGEAY